MQKELSEEVDNLNKSVIFLYHMEKPNKKYFRRNINSLNEIFEYVSEFIDEYDIPDSNSFAINLAVEEIFTNMVKYQHDNKDDIAIELLEKEGKLIIEFTGFDVKYFDISNIPKVNPDAALEERKVGGLGLHLVNKLMDNIHYSFKDNNCQIILTKTLEK